MKDKLLSCKIKREHSKPEAGARQGCAQREKKPPKKITETYLHNAGLYYLQRFSSSSGNFRDVMIRKIRKSCAHHIDQDFEDCLALLDIVVQKFIDVDLLNDETYTRSMVHSLRRQGKSKRAIEAKLRAKNVPLDLIKSKIDAHDEAHSDADSELVAALILARKRRIGPYKREGKEEEIDHKKHLSIMARAGFKYDTARTVLKMKADEAESLMTL